MFLVFEGIDGSGTTTQIQKLAECFSAQHIPFIQTAEPTEGNVGKYIREILSGKTNLSSRALQILFFADRADHCEKKINPALQSGKKVLSDRFALSTIAYSALSGDEMLFCEMARFFPQPDYTIFLRIDPKIAISRIAERGKQKDIFERKDLLEKIADAYEVEISKIPDEKKVIFDSGVLGIEEIAEKIAHKFCS